MSEDPVVAEMMEALAQPISAMYEAIMDLRGGRMVGPLESARWEALRSGRVVEGYAVRWGEEDRGHTSRRAAEIGFDRDPKKARATMENLRRRWPEKGPFSLVPVQMQIGPPLSDAAVEELCEVQTWLARREQEILRERHGTPDPEGTSSDG